MKVDLDVLQRHLDGSGSVDGGPEYQIVGLLIAELRAAREVVKEADSMRSFLPLELVHRLNDYDEAVGS